MQNCPPYHHGFLDDGAEATEPCKNMSCAKYYANARQEKRLGWHAKPWDGVLGKLCAPYSTFSVLFIYLGMTKCPTAGSLILPPPTMVSSRLLSPLEHTQSILILQPILCSKTLAWRQQHPPSSTPVCGSEWAAVERMFQMK